MSDNELDGNECTELDDRDVRALTECMTVLPQDGDIFEVVGENGGTYRVDGREGRCTCPDARHRNPDGGCKHQRRVAFATGERPVPAWVDTRAVDPLLGEHTDTAARVAATDGGIIEAGDEGEILDGDGRPDDCDCGAWNDGLSLPCWPCYRDGFDTPNLDADS
jgi:hypothetical protein